MEEKKKAIELIEKFRMHDIQVCDLVGNELEGYEERNAKKNALICVDETLNFHIKYTGDKKGGFHDFWKRVKEEINQQ